MDVAKSRITTGRKNSYAPSTQHLQNPEDPQDQAGRSQEVPSPPISPSQDQHPKTPRLPESDETNSLPNDHTPYNGFPDTPPSSPRPLLPSQRDQKSPTPSVAESFQTNPFPDEDSTFEDFRTNTKPFCCFQCYRDLQDHVATGLFQTNPFLNDDPICGYCNRAWLGRPSRPKQRSPTHSDAESFQTNPWPEDEPPYDDFWDTKPSSSPKSSGIQSERKKMNYTSVDDGVFTSSDYIGWYQDPDWERREGPELDQFLKNWISASQGRSESSGNVDHEEQHPRIQMRRKSF